MRRAGLSVDVDSVVIRTGLQAVGRSNGHGHAAAVGGKITAVRHRTIKCNRAGEADGRTGASAFRDDAEVDILALTVDAVILVFGPLGVVRFADRRIGHCTAAEVFTLIPAFEFVAVLDRSGQSSFGECCILSKDAARCKCIYIVGYMLRFLYFIEYTVRLCVNNATFIFIKNPITPGAQIINSC